MRPATVFAILLVLLLSVDALILHNTRVKSIQNNMNMELLKTTVSGLGLTDLCISTEARYTRHPAVSDRVVAFMDHPGAIEHFPTGSFWAPVFYK